MLIIGCDFHSRFQQRNLLLIYLKKSSSACTIRA